MMIAVLGAGSWGTTLADLLARKAEAQVRIWAYEPEVVEAINSRHENPVFLPGTTLDDRLAAYGDARRAVEGADLVLSVIPSHAVRSVVSRLRGAVPSGTIVVSATKGIEIESLKLMSEVLGENLDAPRIAILSGPSFAEEVGAGEPTAVVAAAERQETADRVQEVFSTPVFRVYSNLDVIGVQLAGALKNVIAIAAGMIEGLGLGNNPRAALVTRGLAEITRVGVARGADPMTFAGLAGLGDLLLTT
ncbi:MAG: NAD(P)H-dependent glycerol-3-phosphate dehydrogenase, partial [Gemmatimonadales bacterium]